MMENYQIDINKENKKTDDIYNIATEILKNAHRIPHFMQKCPRLCCAHNFFRLYLKYCTFLGKM